MKIDDLKTMDEASDRDMLNFIFATQLQIMRRLDFLESKLTNEEAPTHEDTTKDMLTKVDSFIDRINDHLSLSDMDKGRLKL